VKRRQVFWLTLGLLSAFALAVFLRTLVQTYIILPFTKFLWNLVILYHFFPQVDYWFLLIGVLVVITVASLSPSRPNGKKKDESNYHKRGNVERIAFWIERSKRSVYSRWHVAHMLAETGLKILEYRERRCIPDRTLAGKDWDPPPPVQDYLQNALKTTYCDYSHRRPLFGHPKIPFDQELRDIVEFLESQLEDGHEHPHP